MTPTSAAPPEKPDLSGMLVPLESVEIENFRGIRHMTLDLHPQVTVLFGSNAAGKTSILDATAIALSAIHAQVPHALGRGFAKTGDLRVPWKDRFVFQEWRGVACPFVRVGITTAANMRWDVSRLRSKADRSSLQKKWGVKQLNDVLDPVIREILDTPPDTLTPPFPLVAAYGTERALVDLPMRERYFQKDFHRLGGLDQSLEATTRFKTVFEWFRVMEDEERRQAQKRGSLSYRLPELEWVRTAVSRAQLRCLNPRVETRPIRMLVDFDHGNGEIEPLNIDSLSDGYRTHFSLVIDIARRMVQLNPSDDLNDPRRGTNTQAIILIDEVDLHLDPVWQSTVVQGLKSAFPNAQFIITTHSEQVIGSVDADCVRKLVWGNGEVRAENVPFAQGATGERILIDLMRAPERVPGPITDKLNRYLHLVSSGAGRTDEAARLRAELDAELPNDPMLHQAELELQRRALMARFGGRSE